MHTSESGRTVVHRHFDEHDADHHGLLDHDDHHAASTVASAFVVSRAQQFQPAVTVEAFSLAAPERGTRAHVAVLDEPAIHGPPRQSSAPRAPPV